MATANKHSLEGNDGNQPKGTHPHDTVEGELGLILVVASLTVAFAGVIVNSVEGDQLDVFNLKCLNDRASDDTDVSDLSKWCNATTNFFPTVSWLALLTGAMSFLGSIILYVAWRRARPEVEDYDGSNVFFKSISAKVTIVYVLLGLSILFICFAQLLLQLYKFSFRFHGTIVYVGIGIVMLFIGFGIWTCVDYYKYTRDRTRKKKEKEFEKAKKNGYSRTQEQYEEEQADIRRKKKEKEFEEAKKNGYSGTQKQYEEEKAGNSYIRSDNFRATFFSPQTGMLNKHPHDIVEQEIALILIVSALLVTFTGLIVDSVHPKSFAYFEAKCIAGQTNIDSYVKSQAYWCDSATNNLAICSWVAMLASAMGYLGSLVLYTSWRYAGPDSDDDDACNVYYRTVNFKIITIYSVLAIAFIAIAGAQFMHQIFKFDFQHHRTCLYLAAVVVILILLFVAWVVYDYRNHLLRLARRLGERERRREQFLEQFRVKAVVIQRCWRLHRRVQERRNMEESVKTESVKRNGPPDEGIEMSHRASKESFPGFLNAEEL